MESDTTQPIAQRDVLQRLLLVLMIPCLCTACTYTDITKKTRAFYPDASISISRPDKESLSERELEAYRSDREADRPFEKIYSMDIQDGDRTIFLHLTGSVYRYFPSGTTIHDTAGWSALLISVPALETGKTYELAHPDVTAYYISYGALFDYVHYHNDDQINGEIEIGEMDRDHVELSFQDVTILDKSRHGSRCCARAFDETVNFERNTPPESVGIPETYR